MSEITLDPALSDLDWDGQCLRLPRAWSAPLAIEIDGCYFSDVIVQEGQRFCYAIPISPSGQSRLNVVVRAGRQGTLLHEHPFAIEIGKAGIHPATTSAPLLPFDSNLQATSRAARPRVAVIIPIYNAAAAAERCIESVLRHTVGADRLILINDASTDPSIVPLLNRYTQRKCIDVLHNETNLGFTGTVNRGMQHAAGMDVVLLNADTEVAANWLRGLQNACYAEADIATATAVSDNAGAFSVPELEQENPWPSVWSFDQAARALWQDAGTVAPELPTGNGFCLYIRRTVLDAVGLFDAEAFPQGYGEENDFCQRASVRGGRHVIAGNVFVHHERSLSFGIERRTLLGQQGAKVIRERWPNYDRDVGAMLFSFERRVVDWRVRRIYSAAQLDASPRPRALRIARVDDACQIEDFDIWHAALHRDTFVWLRESAHGTIIVEHAPACQCDDALLSMWLIKHAIELVDCAIDPSNAIAIHLRSAASRTGCVYLETANMASITAQDYERARNRSLSFSENRA